MNALFQKLLRLTWTQKCPHCEKAPLFQSFWSLEPVEHCAHCNFPWKKNDSGDGPAVFLSFILGFSIIPIALLVNASTHWPLWLHGLIWGALILVLSVGLLKPSKALTIALQYLYRPRDWKDDTNGHDDT